ncbi:MAG: restriction endonuclease subunit S [Pseudomonadota bacterium]
MPHFKKYKLRELIERITSGGTPSTSIKEYYGGNIPWLKTQEVDFNRIYRTETFITEEGLKNSSAKLIKENSVIIAMYGNTAAKVAINKIPLTTNQACCNITVDKTKADYRFIYYYFLKEYENLKSLANGGAQQNLNAGIIRDYEIQAPNLPTQTRIASILSSLDDKIELNRRTNHTLEQIAQTLFKKYFVDDIDPENLPEGWRWGKLGEIFTKSNESINPGKFPDKSFYHYSLPAYDESKRPSTELGSTILSNKFVVKSNSILFSKLNPRFPRIWPIGKIDESKSICSTEFLVFIPIKPKHYSFTFLQLKQEDLISDLVNKATGTSGSHQRIRPDEILELDAIIPESTALDEFELKVRPMLNKTIENLNENLVLTKIRDSLLPKLMSGEIEVIASEKLSEA